MNTPLPAPGTEDSLTARTRSSYGSLSSGVRLSSVSVEGSKVKTSLDWLSLEVTLGISLPDTPVSLASLADNIVPATNFPLQ